MKIDIDKRTDLYELINGEGYPTLVAILEHLKQKNASDVLQYRFTPGADGLQELAIRKATYDGAEKLIVDLQRVLTEFKSNYEKSERISRG